MRGRIRLSILSISILLLILMPSAAGQERNQIAVIRLIRQGLARQDVTEGLFLVGPDDEVVTRIYKADTFLFAGSWSPDGTQLVFVREDDGGNGDCHVVVVESDGANPHSILDRSAPMCVFHPSWSPDGSTILFQDHFNLFTMRPDGSHVLKLTHFTQARAYVEGVAWSPTGLRIAFARQTTNGGGRLFVMRTDGSEVTKIHSCSSGLCRSGFQTANPSWSPSGRRIAFEEARNILWTGPGGRYVHRITSCPRTIRAQNCAAFSPSWSPSSNRIAFETNGRLRIVDVKTRWSRTIGPTRVSSVVWRPL